MAEESSFFHETQDCTCRDGGMMVEGKHRAEEKLSRMGQVTP